MSLSSPSIHPDLPPVTWPLFTLSCSISPGFANGYGMGARAFPGVGAQPGEDTWAKVEFKEGGRGGARGSGEQKIDFYREDRGRVCLSGARGLFLGLGRGVKPQKPGEPKTLPSCPPILTLSSPIPVLLHSQVLRKSTSHTTVFLHWQWPEGPAGWEELGEGLRGRGQGPGNPPTMVPSRGALSLP